MTTPPSPPTPTGLPTPPGPSAPIPQFTPATLTPETLMTSPTAAPTCAPGSPARVWWTTVLTAGGRTTVPRWTLEPAPGVATVEVPLPGPLSEALSEAVLVAAHAKVLAAVSGEPETVVGLVTPAGPLPLRLPVEPGSWRALLDSAQLAAAELRTHQDFPVEALRAELGVAGPVFETEVDPAGPAPEPAGEVVLTVGVRDGLLQLRHRTDVLDAAAGSRIAGYHLAALAQLTDAPGTDHTASTLLSDEERAYQLEGLAGPIRPLPDRRFHELVEERVRRHPDAIAAVQGDVRWTYAELNDRANRLARALQDQGLEREGVVGVVTERNLDWMAAVLAVFKAGGVYLPIEPHFPAERILKTLTRAEAALVVTEPGSTETLDRALDAMPEVRVLTLAGALAEEADGSDLGVAVGPDQAAYVYFTSGSTGEPKGAMCEHAGMLNHLLAKIEDLEIAEGAVVAQTAPQCFDISLWQLVSALLVGGRTVVVPQDSILDVERFVDTIVEEQVAVVQLVPSYLEVVLSYLERTGRELPDLRCVSATGEALKTELAQRFFGQLQGVALVNAYGLTETSDDTNHEVMRSAPAKVVLGPAVRNVRVYVTDENLEPVPLGAPGLICFAGVCVGRGYVNDPERTRAVYLTDPHVPGERLYRGGDYGRWTPEGKLEFLGRRDSQVKIRGFRIEIGEIENALSGIPGVRSGAVVVAERPGAGAQLVAFYAAAQDLPVDLLRGGLARTLPVYMVPAAFHRREPLPLTANGKIDTKVLTALAAELGQEPAAAADHEAPATPAEQRLAAAFAQILGVPEAEISRHDHFFDRGGSSLSAVKLAVALDRAVSLKDITRNPVLSDLATLLDAPAAAADPAAPAAAAELLQPLATGADPGRALVCFPPAGGNAVNFRPVAGRLTGMTVFGVEPPGHDPSAAEKFVPLAEIVERVTAEITARKLTRVLLWGHSSGTAYAVATARALDERGVHVELVVLSSQQLGDPTTRRNGIVELSGRSDAALVDRLRDTGLYPELDQLDAEGAQRVAAAYRHDCIEAHRYLADAATSGIKVTAPVVVVRAADDPSTADETRRRDWELLAGEIRTRELDGGGHHFLRSRPDEAAAVVLDAARAASS
ncbi:amino acid adenylation domain-containing protein [Pseudonocardia sp. RS11V-5]|uniref:non-ribosomal peptide synthetase n=1 Tax=Pseudonocardia terrae TaxID=2905831 RepID=UPI001E567CE3|nr:amino acid adenylation domain-containing protein [Pseudonocardia terrae]MCE3550960.1 amino acid adenylation domain-containing protein [Pseudonocardia terrae]